MKILPILHNIRSTYNVGAILRTADGLGIAKVGLSGYTPCYGDADLLPHLREKLNRQIAKSALGAEETVAQEKIKDLAEWLETAKAQGALIVGLENNLNPDEVKRRLILGEDAAKLQRNLANSRWKPMNVAEASQGDEVARADVQKNDEIVLILGEEVAGIPAEIRPLMDFFSKFRCGERKSHSMFQLRRQLRSGSCRESEARANVYRQQNIDIRKDHARERGLVCKPEIL